MRRHLLLLVAAALVALPTGAAWAAADPARPRQWDLDKIGADVARRVADGRGTVVAVVDSGIDLPHEDLAGRLVPGHDFVDDDDQPQDAYGHGTHVAGIIAADADNGRGIAGVAPGAKIMPIRVLGPDGSGTLEDVVAGIRFAVKHGADVVNLSLGEDTQAILGPAFGDVLREAWAAGVVPVVSAGNQFLTGSGFSDEPAIVVAATNRADGKPTYSSGVGRARWGMSAPGGEIPDLGTDGAILSTYWTGAEPNQYAYLAGTSQAAPHVAGAVALLLSTGRFTPQQAVDRLLQTAHDVGPAGHDATFGAGRLDLAAATAGLRPTNRPAEAEAETEVEDEAPPRPAADRPAVRATTTTMPGPPPAGAPVVAAPAPTTTTSTTAPEPVEVVGDLDAAAPTGADDDGVPLAALPAALLILAVAGGLVATRRRSA